jgi:hypothetical protein
MWHRLEPVYYSWLYPRMRRARAFTVRMCMVMAGRERPWNRPWRPVYRNRL